MKIQQSHVQKGKLAAHVIQGFLIFIAGCLVLAVFTKGGEVGGAPKWFFALCFVSIPALIYLTMTPMWSRTVRFANAYAFAVLDVLFSIFWLSAFISTAIWNAKGIRQGAEDAKVAEGNCSTFAYGSEGKCKVSKASVVFGVLIFLLFVVTAAISIRFAAIYKKTGNAPWDAPMPDYSASALEAQNKDAWSADTNDIADNDSDTHTERGGNQEEDEYALLHSTETDDGRHPGRPVGWGGEGGGAGAGGRYDDVHHEDTAYRGGSYNERLETPADALSPGGYDDFRRGGGYTFSRGDEVR